jgi:ketosteroid isomerase-like protein
VSREYVAIVRDHVDAFNRADVEALMAICSDDVLFLPGRSALQGGYRGEEGLRSFFADNADTFELIMVHLDEFHDAGDRVVGIGQVRIRPLGGGPETEIPAGIVYSFDGGKIVRVEDLRDRAAALSAVGLGEHFQD